MNQRKQKSISTSKRIKLVLGRHVKQSVLAFKKSPDQEKLFIRGPVSSGMTWVGYSLVGKSIFGKEKE